MSFSAPVSSLVGFLLPLLVHLPLLELCTSVAVVVFVFRRFKVHPPSEQCFLNTFILSVFNSLISMTSVDSFLSNFLGKTPMPRFSEVLRS